MENQEEWEVQDNFNELDIDEVIDGGDTDETTNEDSTEGE